MYKRLFLLICLLLMAAVALVACSPETETVEVTRVVTETETITEEVTRVVTEEVVEEVEVTRVVTEEVVVEAAVDESEDVLPRNETMFFNGQQWGPIASWNPYSGSANNAMAIDDGESTRVTMFEPLYLYNMLDGKV